jgi:4-amino-4-deoxy-L-arabinose transferase-like glycosyltransferase
VSVLLPSNSWLLLGEILGAALILPWAFLTITARAKRRTISWLADNIEAHWDREAETADRVADAQAWEPIEDVDTFRNTRQQIRELPELDT